MVDYTRQVLLLSTLNDVDLKRAHGILCEQFAPIVWPPRVRFCERTIQAAFALLHSWSGRAGYSSCAHRSHARIYDCSNLCSISEQSWPIR